MFDRNLYFKVLAVVLLVAALGLTMERKTYGQSDNVDTVGAILCSFIVAYIIQLLILNNKKPRTVKIM